MILNTDYRLDGFKANGCINIEMPTMLFTIVINEWRSIWARISMSLIVTIVTSVTMVTSVTIMRRKKLTCRSILAGISGSLMSQFVSVEPPSLLRSLTDELTFEDDNGDDDYRETG